VNANGQIPVSEVLSYCSLMNISDPQDRQTILEVINGINQELSDYQLSKQT
jgi:hypothetical protein